MGPNSQRCDCLMSLMTINFRSKLHLSTLLSTDVPIPGFQYLWDGNRGVAGFEPMRRTSRLAPPPVMSWNRALAPLQVGSVGISSSLRVWGRCELWDKVLGGRSSTSATKVPTSFSPVIYTYIRIYLYIIDINIHIYIYIYTCMYVYIYIYISQISHNYHIMSPFTWWILRQSHKKAWFFGWVRLKASQLTRKWDAPARCRNGWGIRGIGSRKPSETQGFQCIWWLVSGLV